MASVIRTLLCSNPDDGDVVPGFNLTTTIPGIACAEVIPVLFGCCFFIAGDPGKLRQNTRSGNVSRNIPAIQYRREEFRDLKKVIPVTFKN
jgi:hypothetical protein